MTTYRETQRRLVFIEESLENNYSIFNVAGIKGFPNPDTPLKIHKAASKMIASGTSLSAYCSNQLVAKQIIREVTSELKDITHESHVGMIERGPLYEKCWKYIESKTKEYEINPQTAHEFVRKSETDINQICTDSHINSLVVERALVLIGNHRCLGPEDLELRIKFTADNHFNMAEALFGGQFFMGKAEIGVEKMALGWFQGHLHLFKLEFRRDGIWHPVTDIKHLKNNGRAIASFMWKNSEGLRAFKRYIVGLRKSSNHVSRNLDTGSHSQQNRLGNPDPKALKQNMIEGLSMEPANGKLGCLESKHTKIPEKKKNRILQKLRISHN
ncbi:BgtAc-30634 [Blumeria graminis f. sp. tritici]|uniref:BgtAc-30634 n=2 Tax=Blumeria graminis f. sp. tritici TaxID=62690 RepID=A0A9X9MG97_BLUGR|nr:hypothetical protein BGT96224_Ac30634 [Blumeria graminis f. sp. tritici 96224]VDB85922.1 BgtAc-30634 [Blumeria graminis f. sp. tritici]